MIQGGDMREGGAIGVLGPPLFVATLLFYLITLTPFIDLSAANAADPAADKSSTINQIVFLGLTASLWLTALISPARHLAVGHRGVLIATLKRAPNNPFVEALETRVVQGSAQPWGVILTAGFSRTAILGHYASLERLHSDVLAGVDPTIVEQRLLTRGPRPFYQVRIGAPDRMAAYNLCNRIRKNHGACVILRNPQSRG